MVGFSDKIPGFQCFRLHCRSKNRYCLPLHRLSLGQFVGPRCMGVRAYGLQTRVHLDDKFELDDTWNVDFSIRTLWKNWVEAMKSENWVLGLHRTRWPLGDLRRLYISIIWPCNPLGFEVRHFQHNDWYDAIGTKIEYRRSDSLIENMAD